MLTQWIQKIISMLLVMSAVLQVIPGKDYEKYIRFFCGLVLILLALSPVAALKGLKAEQFYQREVYQQYEKEIERMSDSIKREEIGIGQELAGVEGKDRGIHKEDKTGGSWSEKNKISHFIPVWTAASCSCGSGSEDRGGG